MARQRSSGLPAAPSSTIPRGSPALIASKAEAALRDLERNPALPRSGVTGEIYYRAANGRIVALAPGAEGQVLTMINGAPTWRTP